MSLAVDRLLALLARGAAPRIREWLDAAAAERHAAPPGLARLEWTAGLFAILGAHLLTRVLAPWSRGRGDAPPYGFAASLGVALTLPALWAVVFGWTGLDGLAGFGVMGGLALAAWINLGVVWAGQHIAGLTWAVGVRAKPVNLLLVAGPAGLAAVLLGGLRLAGL